MRQKSKIGDIIEIPTSRGYGYAQYTYHYSQPPKYGALLRVFPGTYKYRPDNFTLMAEQDPQFYIFFPLGAAIKQGIVTIAANVPVPERFKSLPTMRVPGFIDREGKVHDWWIIDWKKDRQVNQLSNEERKLSLQEVINDTLLIERIVSGWKPEDYT